MELIDRYLNAVVRSLPKKKRADIKDELRSSLLDAVEGRYGANPTDHQVAGILREYGSPTKMSASYWPAGQYLIGPGLYSTYKTVLIIVALATAFGLGTAFISALVVSPAGQSQLGEQLLSFGSAILQSVLMGMASVTLIFAILQRLGVGSEQTDEEWDPLDLPKTAEVDYVNTTGPAIAITFSAVVLLILNLFKGKLGLIYVDPSEPLLIDVLVAQMPWINAALLLSISVNIALLAMRRWTWLLRTVKLAIDIFWLYVGYRLITAIASQKEVLAEAGLSQGLVQLVTRGGYALLALIAVLILLDAVKTILAKRPRES